jgi:hypothetical protein
MEQAALARIVVHNQDAQCFSAVLHDVRLCYKLAVLQQMNVFIKNSV